MSSISVDVYTCACNMRTFMMTAFCAGSTAPMPSPQDQCSTVPADGPPLADGISSLVDQSGHVMLRTMLQCSRSHIDLRTWLPSCINDSMMLRCIYVQRQPFLPFHQVHHHQHHHYLLLNLPVLH